MAAVYPGEDTALPVTYDFPSCDSTDYMSILACPRDPHVCPESSDSSFNGQAADGNGVGSGESGSGSGSGSGSRSNVLGMLTRHGQIGRRAFTGLVGVRCEGTHMQCC